MTTDELNELQRVCCGFVVADLKAICGAWFRAPTTAGRCHCLVDAVTIA